MFTSCNTTIRIHLKTKIELYFISILNFSRLFRGYFQNRLQRNSTLYLWASLGFVSRLHNNTDNLPTCTKGRPLRCARDRRCCRRWFWKLGENDNQIYPTGARTNGNWLLNRTWRMNNNYLGVIVAMIYRKKKKKARA